MTRSRRRRLWADIGLCASHCWGTSCPFAPTRRNLGFFFQRTLFNAACVSSQCRGPGLAVERGPASAAGGWRGEGRPPIVGTGSAAPRWMPTGCFGYWPLAGAAWEAGAGALRGPICFRPGGVFAASCLPWAGCFCGVGRSAFHFVS